MCFKAKQTHKKLNKKKDRKRSTNLFENVHSDVNELPMRSIDNEKYFVTFVEESTHFTTVFNLKLKSEVFKYYKFYELRMLATYNRPAILNLYCDNGGEYVSHEFNEYVQTKGTVLHKTVPYTSALNGIAERSNRTIMDRDRACLIQSGLPPRFWNYAVIYAVYIINRSPTTALPDGKTPYEMLTGTVFDYSKLQVFGCVVYVRPRLESKLHERSEKGIFLGFTTNGCKVLNLVTRKILPVVRDVEFDSTTLYRDLPASEKLGNMPVTPEIEIQSYQSLQSITPRTVIDPKVVNNTTTTHTTITNTNENDRHMFYNGENHDSIANTNTTTNTTVSYTHLTLPTIYSV